MYDLRFDEYHTNKKLADAVELLKSNTMDVQEVAIQIGYADTSSFIEAFKNKYNKTPLKVKKMRDSLDTHKIDKSFLSKLQEAFKGTISGDRFTFHPGFAVGFW